MVAPRQKVRADDVFFPAMALLILGIVVFGFWESYFSAGMLRAKLPNALVHIHGGLFVAWIFLLLIQNALVAGRRVRWHIALGSLGAILPPLMVIFGVLTLFDSIRRNGTGLPPQLLLVGDLEELALFAGITVWGMLVRRNAASHKRLMILGTMAILGPAINRWPFPDFIRLPGTIAVTLAPPLMMVAYDLWSLRKVHRSTAVATTLIVMSAVTLIPVMNLGIWQPWVSWIKRT